ncbi:hypothetical protein N6H14_25035 [Paenibacillus sp. CC-CFT747]|nr:hypothetical protein N6H14_25035 [Paenibacillus sp. CC-CFT747]
MPYILRQRETGQVYSCMLVNAYRLPYYGTKFWETEEAAENEAPDFLRDQGQPEEAWVLTEVDESRLKLFNVKLRNNVDWMVFYEEGKGITAEKRPGR